MTRNDVPKRTDGPKFGLARRPRLVGVAMLVAVACLGASIASGETGESKGVIVSLQGRIAPHALPREKLAPITVHVQGRIRSSDGTPPPELRKITIALNRGGELDTHGLPLCNGGQLEATTTDQARAVCGPALVGHGSFEANVNFPSLAPFPAEGKLLAFNAKIEGRPGILLHIYGKNPVQLTFVLPMTITHPTGGIFGTVVSTTIPRLAGGLGHVTSVDFAIGRKFNYRGKTHSLLSASCAAPPGFSGALFTFAKGTFSFSNGATVSPNLVRDCKVRE